VVVDSLAAPGSLFDGVTDCYGGGGAAIALSFSSYPTVTGADSMTPGCGGGALITAATLPADLSSLGLSHTISPNTGGGAGAGDSGAEPNDGSDGLVVLRYTAESDGETGVDETLGNTGAAPLMLGSIGVALAAVGAWFVRDSRRTTTR
jgi:hypothetical protein